MSSEAEISEVLVCAVCAGGGSPALCDIGLTLGFCDNSCGRLVG